MVEPLQMKNTKDLLMNINKNLNKEYPKFLKAIPKLSNKDIMKHKLMKLLEAIVFLYFNQLPELFRCLF